MEESRSVRAASLCILAVLTAAAAWLLSGALPEAGVPLRLVISGIAALLSMVSWRAAGRLPLRALLPLAAVTSLLLLLRIYCFPRETSDFTDFLKPWTEWYRSHGGLKALGQNVGNYNIPYLFLLALFSCWDVPELYLIKLVSVSFDVLLAFTVCRIVLLLTGSSRRSAVGFALTLAVPTVFINGSVWGQCDSIYVSLALLGLYLCLTEKPAAGMVALGVSFAFKLQAVFLIPVFLACLLSRRLKLLHLPLFPASYLLAVSPGLLAGKSLKDVLLFYLNTAGTAGDALNYNSPSVFSLRVFWYPQEPERLARLGILCAAALCVLLALLLLLRRKQIDDRSILCAAILFCCGIPLLLPHMHDRYFYFCDVLAVALACVYPWSAPLVLCTQFASLLGYYAYFRRVYLLPMHYGFWALVPLMLTALILCFARLFPPRPAPEVPSDPPGSPEEQPPSDGSNGAEA